MKVIHQNNGQVIATDVKEAFSFWKRLKGLLFTSKLGDQDGLYLFPCSSIHTFFMKYPIDVVYLSDDHVVLATEEKLQPWKTGKRVKEAKAVIELAEGKVAKEKIQPGQKLIYDALMKKSG